MSRTDDHREVSSGRASKETTRRFKGALRREVGDLEVRLEEAQLRSDAFLHAGLDREAAEVLEESRQMLDEFHQRLNSALAAAAVEREAEWILASSLDVVDVLGDDETTGGGLLARIPAGVGAAVASFAVLAMALVTLRTPQQREVRPASDIALALPDDRDASASTSPSRLGPALDRRLRSFSPAEIEVLADVSEPEAVAPLLERRRLLLDQLQQAAIGGSSDLDTVLAELDLLVEALVREGVDVDRLMELEREQEFERVAEGPEEGQAQDPAPEPQGPAEQPQDEAADDEAPADGSDDGSGGVFPFEDGDGEPDEDSEDAEATGSDNGDKSDDGGLLSD